MGIAGHRPTILLYNQFNFPAPRGCVLSNEHVERRLAAILAADVVGSCRLIGIDEEGTLAQLKDLRKTLFDPKIAEHHGRIVKNTGDGALVEFASAVDAVRCADNIQRDVAEQNTDVPQDKRIEFRIGIHVGDIIIGDDDIFGDGVNSIAVILGDLGGVAVTLAGYPLALLAGGVGLGSFTRSMIAPQSVAISTRSSLASLPAMLAAARLMGIREQVADVTLPMSVALFRATGPAMNVAVAFYVAHWLGYEPSVSQMIAATAVAAVISYGAVSLPGEVSFISSIAPIAMALGIPIAPLALLVAVEMVPDIFRTLGNVTLDVAVTAVVNRGTQDKTAAA